jgi:flagellar hook protein FlgE
MSINSALLAGVSGLRANSSAMAAISDNIANVNTNAYKRSDADFLTLVTNRSRSGSYNAGGVTTATRRYISQEGQLEQSVNSTDLGIKGQGFFVVTEKAEGVMPTDTRSFTRLGSFEADALGYLRNSAGLYLQGWAVNQNGGRDPRPLRPQPPHVDQRHGHRRHRRADHPGDDQRQPERLDTDRAGRGRPRV